MTPTRRTLGTLLGATALALLVVASAAAGPIYTAYNIWWEKPDKVYSTNYGKGTLLPAGSEVTDVKTDDGKASFTDVATSGAFRLEFVPKHHPGVKGKAFWDRFLTPKSLAELTQGFTEAELDGIKAGEARVGMRKEAVVVALGYPPETRTASLDLDTWVYWHDRFRSYAVQFADGKVTSVGR